MILSIDHRQVARDIFLHALRTATIEAAFARHVHCERGVLRVCDDLFSLDAFARVHVVSFGKAGQTMAEAFAYRIGNLGSGIIAAPESALTRTQLPGFRY